MSTRVTERVDDWTAQPFEGGYGELRDLAASEFSGVVRASGVALYMTKGTAVGIFGGSIEAFEGGGTVHEAPTPALPLLGVMQERDGEVRAEYYTEETAISEVDEKLSGTGFTGYVELSERVLSGDYYLVYHGGRSMSVAFVGNTGRLLEGEEAFERANGEVGIYSVYPADIDPVGIPEPTAPDSGPGSAAGAGAGAGAGAPAGESITDETGAGGDTEGESASGPGGDEDADREAAEDETGVEDGDDGERERDANVAEAAASPADAGGTAGEGTAENAGDDPGGATGSADGTAADPAESGGTVTADTGGSTAESGGDGLETRSVPSPDPDRTQADAVEAGAGDDAPGSPDSDAASSQSSTAGEGGPGPTADAGDGADRLERLETELEEREAEVDRLEEELRSVTEDRDRLEEELRSVTEDRDELAVEVERLEAELGRPDSPGTRTDAERRLGPEEALEATDVFVRYRSKGDATLAKARDGGARREDLVGNLLLETHTQFDAGAAAVDGRDYGEFLENTVEHQFLEWLTEDLIFEIRETGNADPLATLYGALPEVDRVELRGSVDLDTADGRETEQFDLVCRDRMGDPLAVANFNDSREAATESMMEDLVTAAERVGRASDGLAAAFLVTTSFFEPGALETASEATRGGLLNRSKHKSFVNLSRKRGYHLCLVEARGGNFNLTVPEL